MKSIGMIACVVGLAAGFPAFAAPESPAAAVSPGADTQAQARAMAEKAIAYLKGKQDASGGWSIPAKGPTNPAITALVLQGMLAHEGMPVSDPAVNKAAAWLVKKQQADGGIYDTILPVYNTAISITALAKMPTPECRSAVVKGREFLKKLQFFEDTMAIEGNADSPQPVKKDDPMYGGWGYGNHGRPDISNTAFAVEALKASGLDAGDPAFQRALIFLQRCQMMDRVNDLEFAKGTAQGGFVYATSVSKDVTGRGQSPAGEMVESLSGPPGSSVTFTLKKDVDGRPPYKKAQLTALLREKFGASSTAEIREHAADFMLVLGPGTQDGESGLVMTIRAQIAEPATLASAVREALGEQVADGASLKGVKVQSWQGETHLRSYGSMSYAGLKSYLYAGLSKNDPRVKAVVEWAAQNYTLDENPGVGMDGYYYYILMFGRAMEVHGEPQILVADGPGASQRHDWRSDLVTKLASLQQPDGSFKTVDNRWMESNDVLITSYALIALDCAAK